MSASAYFTQINIIPNNANLLEVHSGTSKVGFQLWSGTASAGPATCCRPHPQILSMLSRRCRRASKILEIETNTLPTGHVVKQVTSDSGDECHHDITGLDDATLWTVFEKKDLSDFSICTNGEYRQVTEAEILAQRTAK